MPVVRGGRRSPAPYHGPRQLGATMDGIQTVPPKTRPVIADVGCAAKCRHEPPAETPLHSSQKSWWLVVENGVVDLCNFDPGYELDLLVRSSLKSMTAIWMGLSTVMQEADAH